MEIQETEVHAAQNNSSCVLQRNSCREHHGLCLEILTPEHHDLIHRPGLPPELQSLIGAEIVVDQPQCIKYVFSHCYNPWGCKDGSHPFGTARPRVTPSSCYTSKCQLVHEEGYKAFFHSSVFIFESYLHSTLPPSAIILASMPPLTDNDAIREWLDDLAYGSRGDRDYLATRLLDFRDSPDWKGQGSPEFKRYVERFDTSYEPVNKYRYTIRHLVFKMGENRLHTKFDYQSKYRPAWAWALMVDWKTLPDLQTLVLDLRGYSYQQLQDPAFPIEIYDEQLVVGAEGMKCLKLKSLIIYGLCSGPQYWGKKKAYKEDGGVISPCHCTRREA